MSSYKDFAEVYDRLMKKDVDYDVACGTGNITIPLARRGYDMTGVDASESMLNVARGKSEGLNILYLCQSMTKIDLYGTMGAFLCMIDGVNHCLSPKSLLTFFKHVRPL